MQRFTLHPAPPFRLDLTSWSLRRLALNQIDRWEDNAWRRVFVTGGPVETLVEQSGPPQHPILTVTVHGRCAPRRLEELRHTLTKILGLEVDLAPFRRMAAQDKHLAPLATRLDGYRPPRFASVFEAVLNGIACQQLSLIVGITLLNRLTARFGRTTGSAHAFPLPEDLAPATTAPLRTLGFSERKAQYILGVARAVSSGRLDLEALADLSDEEALARLMELVGIGRWTAQYVLLRGLGRLDVFPGDDIGAQAAVKKWLNLRAQPDYDRLYRRLRGWAPYRGMIYLFLFINRLVIDRGLALPTGS